MLIFDSVSSLNWYLLIVNSKKLFCEIELKDSNNCALISSLLLTTSKPRPLCKRFYSRDLIEWKSKKQNMH